LAVDFSSGEIAGFFLNQYSSARGNRAAKRSSSALAFYLSAKKITKEKYWEKKTDLPRILARI